MKKIIALLLWFTCVMVACESGKEKSERRSDPSRYPNGGSELAWLMRDLTDSLEIMRASLLQGKTVNFDLPIDHLLSAVPTEEGKTDDPHYQEMAKEFQRYLKEQPIAITQEQKDYFDGLVNRCASCHQKLCPGPLQKINKLKLP
ncbi:hypothetical protein [Persicobacter diffluens]|uniref:Cytochrome c n=1 Tax=Persicobacter diffluens TaxID=981 RepID=A0AAN4W158_9BACT|nr:hypothetical protein PEDI_43230 [Persicobacter diffluens]